MSENCYLCFSKYHHTVSCQFPSTHSTLFLPNIDDVLVSRFCKMLDFIERLKFAFSSSQALNSIDIQPFYVYQRVISRKEDHHEFLPLDKYVVTNNLEFARIFFPSKEMGNFFNRLSSRVTTIAAAKINIEHCKFISDEFLSLLSQNTKSLHCSDVEFRGKINFSDILERLPNIFRVKIYKTNISFTSNWFERLIKRRDAAYLKKLKIDTDTFMFDGEIDYEKIYEKRA